MTAEGDQRGRDRGAARSRSVSEDCSLFFNFMFPVSFHKVVTSPPGVNTRTTKIII